MKIIIIATGKEKDFAGSDIVADYLGRISHYYPVEAIYVQGRDLGDEAERMEKEIDRLGGQVFLVVLDEKGKKMSSTGLAEIIEKASRMSSKHMVFIIGGAYGAPPSIKEKANLVLSLSDMTFPHDMVRLLIAEQIYRACTIQRGEKYHHG